MRKIQILKIVGEYCGDCENDEQYLPQHKDWVEVSEEDYYTIKDYIWHFSRANPKNKWGRPREEYVLVTYTPDKKATRDIIDEILNYKKELEEREEKQKKANTKRKKTLAKKKEAKEKKLLKDLQEKYNA